MKFRQATTPSLHSPPFNMLPVRLDASSSLVFLQDPILVIFSLFKGATSPNGMSSDDNEVVELLCALLWLGDVLLEHLRRETMERFP